MYVYIYIYINIFCYIYIYIYDIHLPKSRWGASWTTLAPIPRTDSDPTSFWKALWLGGGMTQKLIG